MPNNNTVSTIASLLEKLRKERDHHLQAIEEIDSVFARFGATPPRSPGAPRGRRKGRGRGAPGQKRVQGVKETLASALTDSPQSPTELAAKVSRKLGAKVAIATQLNQLKKEKVAKSVGRGQWVRA